MLSAFYYEVPSRRYCATPFTANDWFQFHQGPLLLPWINLNTSMDK